MRMRTEILFHAILIAALMVGIGSVRAGEPAPPVERQVIIRDYTFEPDTLTVPVGATVTWVNHDDEAHAVESKDKGFPSSKLLERGGKYSYTFTAPGTYKYLCSVHSFMMGKIIVTEATTDKAR